MRIWVLPCAALSVLSFMLLPPAATLTQESKTATIGGRVTDCAGGRMPGAEVTLTAPAGQIPTVAVTDENGRFHFSGLPAGAYALEVKMPSFKAFRRTDISLPAGGELTSDVMLFFDPLSEMHTDILQPSLDLELTALWRNIDAVAYLRIERTVGVRRTSQTGSPCENVYIEHQASVLEVFRRHIGKPDAATVNFLQAAPAPGYSGQTTRTAGDPTYRPGEFLVAFLQWDESERAFLAFIGLRVRDGKVQSFDIHEIASGIKIEEFLKILRAMME
ncbi:MAG: carboxypeptidase-like regulatory domain-containing protein [Acidobacteriota bacterium]